MEAFGYDEIAVHDSQDLKYAFFLSNKLDIVNMW